MQELYHELHALDRFDQDYRRKLQEEDNSNATQRGTCWHGFIYPIVIKYSLRHDEKSILFLIIENCTMQVTMYTDLVIKAIPEP